MATTRGTIFEPELVKNLIAKTIERSSIAALCKQTPMAFNGQKEMIFSLDNEVSVVGESGTKVHGGLSIDPVTIMPIKIEYGARVSDEFLYSTEEEKINILQAFSEGFAKKVAKGLDLMVFHGVNPKAGTASSVIGENNFATKVTQAVTYDSTDPEGNLEDAIALVQGSSMEVTGMAFAPTFATALAGVTNGSNGPQKYPQFAFGANPGNLNGMPVDVNSTVSANNSEIKAIVGDFADMFKWGYAKEVPLEVIKYGDPDNSGNDLKGYNQVYLRSEVYIGWGILNEDAFATIK